MAASVIGIVLAERRWRLRAPTQAEPERSVRNLVLGAGSLAVVQLVEAPLVGPLSRLVERRRIGLAQWLPLPPLGPRRRRVPDAGLRHLSLARADPQTTDPVALSPRPPRRSRPRQFHRAPLSRRRHGNLHALPRAAGPHRRRQPPRAPALARLLLPVGAVPPQQHPPAAPARAPPLPCPDHPPHARHPPLRSASRDRQQLVLRPQPMGSSAPHLPPRCPAGQHRGRRPRLSRPRRTRHRRIARHAVRPGP